MKLSIIIPVYRVEATLDRCIESVLGQAIDDFEVILVDDGSPDNCPRMCDEWVQRDPHIRVIHQKNGGLSAARNSGLDVAQGNYITFVDSDDYIGPETYLPLLEVLENNPDIDILEYPVFVFYGSDRQHLLSFDEMTYHDMDDYWYHGQAYQHTYACNKIFRRGLFQEIRFPLGMVFEDANTLPLLLEKAHVVSSTSKGLYYYCANNNGITSTADGEALNMLLKPHVEMIASTRRRDADFQLYYLHVLNIQMDVCELTGRMPILPYYHVNPKNVNGVLKLKAILLNLLGSNNLCCVNKLIHRVWRSH